MALLQDRRIQPRVALAGCDEPDGAVTVFLVVPMHEALHPLACLLHIVKGLVRVGRGVFERAEQGLRVRVVVTHRRATERGHDAQPLQRGEHRGTLHGAAVVGVQHQLITAHLLAQTGSAHQDGRMAGQFLGMHLPAHNGAAVDVHDHVQAPELPFDGAGQVGDVPAPDLVGCLGRKGLGPGALARCLRTPAPIVLTLRPEHAVKA